MTLEQRLDQLAQLQYPHKVDVVDSVMTQVSQRPYLRPVRRSVTWRYISIAAAAVVALFIVNHCACDVEIVMLDAGGEKYN